MENQNVANKFAQIEQEVESEDNESVTPGVSAEDKVSESLTKGVVRLVLESGIELFKDSESKPHVRFSVGNRYKIYPVESRIFKDYVCLLAWSKLAKPINGAVMANVLGTLRGAALAEEKKIELHVRVAWHENALWYDLGDWRAVRIDGRGWNIVEDPPILFRHLTHQQQQVEPIEGDDICDVLKFMNLKESRDEILLLTYLVAVFVPDIARAILLVHGVQGSAKSTFFKLLKSLIDPSILGIVSFPREERELVQILFHHYALYIDNASDLKDWVSDALCRACTGGGFSKRELYTNDDDILYYFKRAIGINGINLVASKPDILDRSIMFELERIPEEQRRTEKELMAGFEQAKPRILGAIFTLLSKAIAIVESGEIVLEHKPRLADYAQWCSAITKAMELPVNTFLDAFKENVESQNAEAIDASPLAQAVREFMKDKRSWMGSAKELLGLLKEKDEEGGFGWSDEDMWPKAARSVWKRIKEVLPNLVSEGIKARYCKGTRPRLISLENGRLNEGDVSDDENGTNNEPRRPELPPL